MSHLFSLTSIALFIASYAGVAYQLIERNM